MFQSLVLDKHLYSSGAQSGDDLRTDTIETCVKKNNCTKFSSFVYMINVMESRETLYDQSTRKRIFTSYNGKNVIHKMAKYKYDLELLTISPK